jgi:hypothetical protein
MSLKGLLLQRSSLFVCQVKNKVNATGQHQFKTQCLVQANSIGITGHGLTTHHRYMQSIFAYVGFNQRQEFPFHLEQLMFKILQRLLHKSTTFCFIVFQERNNKKAPHTAGPTYSI